MDFCTACRKTTKGRFWMKVAFAYVIGYWAYHTSDFIIKDQDLAEEWNPYRVLKLEDDGQFNSKEIREAYKRLSKKWHPDKVNWEKLKGQEQQVEKRW